MCRIEFASTFGNWFFFTIALFASIYLNITTFAFDSAHKQRDRLSETNSDDRPNFTSLIRQMQQPDSQSNELPSTASLGRNDPAQVASCEAMDAGGEAEEGKPD